jgi:hypothetical protein
LFLRKTATHFCWNGIALGWVSRPSLNLKSTTLGRLPVRRRDGEANARQDAAQDTKTGICLMKRLAFLTAVASVLAGSANAQYNDRAACVMFEDAGFGGRALPMGPDDSVNFRAGQFWNDRVSSVLVRRGCTLVAYEDSWRRGRSIEIQRRIRNLDDIGWNDRISSAECYCKSRPSRDAIDRMPETWSWINALSSQDDRVLLYAWAWVKTRRGRTINDFANREGMNNRTLRRQISPICQGIANNLNRMRHVRLIVAVDTASEITVEADPEQISSVKYANHWRAEDAKPRHLPELLDQRAPATRAG